VLHRQGRPAPAASLRAMPLPDLMSLDGHSLKGTVRGEKKSSNVASKETCLLLCNGLNFEDGNSLLNMVERWPFNGADQ
jgi:hypothetical protein